MAEFHSFLETVDDYLLLTEFPKIIPIDTVNFCNLKCSMCMTKDSKRAKGFMDWNLYTKVIDEIASEDLSTRIYMVFSGEPMLRAKHKQSIFAMISYAKNKGLNELFINTNGCLLNEENSIHLLESGIKQIFIGLDAFSSDVYQLNRCGGNYEITKNNVLNLLALQKKINKNDVKIECQFIEMDNNIHQEKDFIKFWTGQGAHVKVRPMCTWAGKIDRKIMVPLTEKRKACYWAMTTMVIGFNGQVVNCACDLGAEISHGNVNEKSIKEIWNTSLKEFRKIHLEGRWNELNSLCKNCKDWQIAGSTHYSHDVIF